MLRIKIVYKQVRKQKGIFTFLYTFSYIPININQGGQCFEQKFSANTCKTKMTSLRSCTPSDIFQWTWAGREYWCLKQKLSTINEKIKWHQFMHYIPMNMSPGGREGGRLWFKQKICRKMKENKNGIFIIYLHIFLAIKREREWGAKFQ